MGNLALTLRVHVEVGTVRIRKSIVIVVQLKNDLVGIRKGFDVEDISLIVKG